MSASRHGSHHHLVSIKNTSDVFNEFRREIINPAHARLLAGIEKARTFEECIGDIAARCGIVLDGRYDVDMICGILLKELRSRRRKTTILIPGRDF